MRLLVILALLLAMPAASGGDEPVPVVPTAVAAPVMAMAPTLPLSGTLPRRIIVADANRADYAGSAARGMFDMASTTALPGLPIQAAGLRGLRCSAFSPIGQGSARAIAIAFLLAPEITHVFWAERAVGGPPGHAAELDRMLREFLPS